MIWFSPKNSKSQAVPRPATVPLDAVPRPSAGFRSHGSPPRQRSEKHHKWDVTGENPRPETSGYKKHLKFM